MTASKIINKSYCEVLLDVAESVIARMRNAFSWDRYLRALVEFDAKDKDCCFKLRNM